MQSRELFEKENLVIYRASAGSGKTHQLTGEYLCLLFSNPYAYRHILAVTFTNKATDEMKSRIIQELSVLASPEKDSDYLKKLMAEYSMPETKVRERARRILMNMLHDYSAFSISTIDRFFQQTMRAFTREIGLGGGYVVELDTKKILRESIDALLYDLERSPDKQLLEWLIRFSEEKIEDGGTWNIRNDIQSLSDEIFKESYKLYREHVQLDISDKEFLDNYKKQLRSVISQFEKKSQAIGERALNIMDRFNLKCEDMKGGSRSPFVTFRTCANGEVKSPSDTFRSLSGNIENWWTGKTPSGLKDKIKECYSEGLNECVDDLIRHYDDMLLYQTAYEINRYFFTLGILGDVDAKIREYTAENNLMLISDTTELLNRIIQGSDSPFIYEKVGSYIDHYMIDEFQDTSGMQWANFQPLIKDSMAAGKRNLIVGDVKQSIYRWRNSDWKLLDEQLSVDFSNDNVLYQSLDSNWRSASNIIDFNNSLFVNSSKILQAEFDESLSDSKDEKTNRLKGKIEKAYKGLFQYIPSTKKEEKGHVRVEFVDVTDDPDWQTYSLQQLPKTIGELQEKGYSLKDIAILVRTKKEGAEVANTLLEYKELHTDSKYKYDIISDEALFVGSSKSIKLIISLLKYLRSPLDNSLRGIAVYEYFKFKGQLATEEALQKHFSLRKDFPEEVLVELERIQQLPLYEMTESISGLFREAMDEKENIYVQSFLDMVLEFTMKHSSDLDAFLEWWNENGTGKNIFTPDGQDAIRIMTIHKSKGLGFEVVLLPFCNWDLDHKLSTILWCCPEIEPFNQLHLVPVKYSQKLKNTIFEYEYFNEKLHAYIDNLNILYVAFTRAKRELIACCPKPLNDKINNIASLLWSCTNMQSQQDEQGNVCICLKDRKDIETGIFEVGEDYRPSSKPVLKQEKEIKVENLCSIPYDERLKLKLDNKYYFSDDGKRQYGTFMHEIISKVSLLDDVEEVVNDYFLSGDITAREKIEITKLIRDFISQIEVSPWYSGEYKILNEVQILRPQGTFIRPDRVMIKDNEVVVIDYKFGEKEEVKYSRQMNYYISQIQKMGYEKVSGYLCYITLGKVVKV